MKLKITSKVSQSPKGTCVYSCDFVGQPGKGLQPRHRLLSRENLSDGDVVVVNTMRGAMSSTCDDDGALVLVWWL